MIERFTEPAYSDAPLYPMSIYVYDERGWYGGPVLVNSEEELHAQYDLFKDAAERGVEVRVTDPGDMMLFHAIGRKVLFDGKEVGE